MDFCAGRQRVAFELDQIMVQIVDHMVFDVATWIAPRRKPGPRGHRRGALVRAVPVVRSIASFSSGSARAD